MNITTFLKELKISKWSAVWAFLTDGWEGLATLVCNAFTKVLQKAPPEKMKGYAELASKIAVFLRGGVETFVEDGMLRKAAMDTATAVAELAEHLSDGTYTTEELYADIANIKGLIEVWGDGLVEVSEK